MTGSYEREALGNWAADYCHSDAVGLFPTEVGEVSQAALECLLIHACARRGNAPDQLDEDDIRHGLLQGVARLGLAESTAAYIPSLCRAYLEDLQRRGRIGNGLSLGRFVGALKQAYADAARSTPVTFTRPAEKIGRNDPCPCGSGRKFKKCCWKPESP